MKLANKNNTSKLIIIVGLPGAGKTTYARKLAEQESAALFILDEMVHEQYGNRHDVELGFREKTVKYDALPQIIDLLQSGKSVILDYGFFKSEERSRYKKLAEILGVEFELHYIKAPYDTLLERVLKRNKEEGNIHHIDKEILDALIKQFEEPEDDEFVKTIDNY